MRETVEGIEKGVEKKLQTKTEAGRFPECKTTMKTSRGLLCLKRHHLNSYLKNMNFMNFMNFTCGSGFYHTENNVNNMISFLLSIL